MALLKSGQKLSSTPTKTRSLSSGFNLTTGKQGKFNQEDYDAFIRSMKTEKATGKKATSSLPSKKKKTKEERYGELLQIDENLTKSEARKNLLKAESEVKSKQSKYDKLLGKEREKQGVEMNVTFEKPDKKDLLTKDKQLVTEKSKKQQLEENAKKIGKSEQNLLATKKGKKAQKDVREAHNKKAIAQYQYDVKKAEGEKTTFADKTIMTPIRAAKDLFSGLTDTENKYVSDSGEEFFLPSYNQMKQEKVQEDMSGIGKFLNTIGYEGTKLGLSAALDAISGGTAGKALYTTDIFTDSYKDAMNKTNNQTAAISTAGIKSGLDLILDLAAGGALKAAGNIGSKISGKAVTKTATRDLAMRIGDKVFEKTGSKILSKFVGTGATEALQEGTEQYLESLSDIIFLGSDEQGNKSVGEMFVKDGKLNTKMLESAAYAASVGFFTGGGFGVMGAPDPQTREMRSLMAFRSELNEQSKTSNEYKSALTQVNDIIQARNKIDSISPYKINKNKVEINGKTIDAKEVKSRLAKIDNMLREGEITDIDTLQRVDNAWRTLNAIDNEISTNETVDEKSRPIESNIKEKQFEIIKNNNPMEDDYHTGIRSTDDIKTANEVFTKENFEEVSNPDFTFEDAQKALETGKVTVYSSKPIENGSFVSTSKMEAESYSGNGKVYTKEVPLDNVAWIENTQGQYTDLSKSQSTQAETIDEKSVQIKQEEKPTNISETEEVFNRYHKDASNISDKYDYNKSTSSHDTGFGISFTTSDKYIKGKNKQDIIQSKLVSKNGFLESNSNKVDTDTINKLNNIFEKYVPDAPKMFQDNITNAELIDNINKASNMIANYEDDNNLGRKSWVEFYKALNKDGYIKQYVDGEKEAVVVSKENIKNIKPSTQAEAKKADNVLTIKQDIEKQGISKWSETALESELLNNKETKKAVKDMDFSYMEITNRNSWNNATETFNKLGYEKAKQTVFDNLNSKSVNVYDSMLAMKVLQESQAREDYQTSAKLIGDIASLGSEFGQVVQSLSVIKKLTPEGQLSILQKTIDRLQKKNHKKYGDLKLTDTYIENILKSNNSEELDSAIDAAKVNLSKEVKGTFADKLRSWRYLSMLGNPKTHIRNILSNMTMLGATKVKNKIQGGLQDIIIRDKSKKTTTLKKTSTEVSEYVDNYTTEHKKMFEHTNKYSIESTLNENNRLFDNNTGIKKALNKLNKFNSDALDMEDGMFKNVAFRDSLKKFLTARGITTKEQIEANPKLFEAGKNFAYQQSLIATFNQANAVANALNKIASKDTKTKIAVEALVPFKRTPANILETGVKYSPLGLINTITKNSVDLKQGKITSAQYLDNLSQGFTGTGLVAIGMLLKNMGLISGGDDDDKKSKFTKAIGTQPYSITIGNKNFTIDWLAPSVMPMFMGVEIADMISKKDWSLNSMSEHLGDLLEPIVNMSYLENITSAIDNYNYNGIGGLIEGFAQSYLLQYIPTAFGQAARLIDKTKRSTKASKQSPWKFGEETGKQVLNKIPGGSFLLEPQTDLYGNNIESTDSFIGRFFYEYLSPAKIQDLKKDKVTNEISNLYRKTKEDKIIPNVPSYGKTLDRALDATGEKYTDKEYTQLKRTYAKTMYNSLDKLFTTKTYKNASNDEKIKLVESVYEYAKDKTKQKLVESHNKKYTNSTSNKEKVYKDNKIKWVIEDDVDLDEAKNLRRYNETYKKKN